jgi:superkiller protein 3
MDRPSHSAAVLFRTSGLLWLISLLGFPSLAQAQRKPPVKTPAQSSQSKEDPLAPLLQQAKDAIGKNDFSSALEPLQKYIAERPDDPYTHFQLGFAYAALKRWDEAKAEFSRAISLDPKMAPAYLNLGLVLMDSNPGEAARQFLHTAELQPAESRPHYLAGVAFEHAGKIPESIEQYRAALAISPKDYEYRFSLGRALLRTGDAPGAEEHFRAAIAVRADSAPARLGLAKALLTQKKYEAAADSLAEYLKLKPDDRAEHFDRASALMELDRFDDALAELDQTDAASTPTPEILKMRSDIYVHQKKWKEARELILKAAQQSPQDQDLPVWLAHAEIELHEYPPAIAILNKVLASNPQSVEAARDMVNALFLSEDYAGTISAMDRVAKLENPKPLSWFVRAICYDKLSKKPEAIELYQKFLDLDNGQNETQDFQARRRIYTLQSELGQAPKRKKY